jgi:hypothetical protein
LKRNHISKISVPLRRLKVVILNLPLLPVTSANCYYGNSSLQKWHDFRGIGRTLEESAGLNGIER